jgi:phenol 2-monooxygenase
MTLPREDRLVRFYIQLAKTESEEDFEGSAITPEKMVEQARKVLEPHTIDFEVCNCHSIYTVSGACSPIIYFQQLMKIGRSARGKKLQSSRSVSVLIVSRNG